MYIAIWGKEISTHNLSELDCNYLKKLPATLPSVEWIWNEMDSVWKQLELNNKTPINKQPKIAQFYGHPVWIMNGIFTELDPVSAKHREAIASFLTQQDCKYMADYGGGSGVLAKLLCSENDNAHIDIIEPFASDFSKSNVGYQKRISFRQKLDGSKYDAVIAQDVLEHVENPIEVASDMALHTKDGGIIIFANCFYPVIECHLPSTFHLRHTFPKVMQAMGLEYLGRISNAEHAQVFRKNGEINLRAAKKLESYSKIVGSSLNFLAPALLKLKRIFRG